MKIMMIGKTGSGKTTLTQILNKEKIEYKKTQSVDYIKDIIDTPGEYLENKNYYKALSVVASEADLIIFLQSAIDTENYFPPNFTGMFLGKKVIGIITKIDLVEKYTFAEESLRNSGVENIFYLNLKDFQGIESLKKYLEEIDEGNGSCSRR